MYVESFEKLSGNDRFEGFAVDLAHELSKVLGFNFTFKLVDDGKVIHSILHIGKSHYVKPPCYSMAVRPHLVTGMECLVRLMMALLTL